MSHFADVGEFHRKFGLEVSGENAPHLPDDETHAFRVAFLREELDELCSAFLRGSLEDYADSLVDLVYVAHGTAHMSSIPFDLVWHEVHAANMRKERSTGSSDLRSTRKHALDVVKPAGWRKPDVAGVLSRWNVVPEQRCLFCSTLTKKHLPLTRFFCCDPCLEERR